jgi:hypothetical protein
VIIIEIPKRIRDGLAVRKTSPALVIIFAIGIELIDDWREEQQHYASDKHQWRSNNVGITDAWPRGRSDGSHQRRAYYGKYQADNESDAC